MFDIIVVLELGMGRVRLREGVCKPRSGVLWIGPGWLIGKRDRDHLSRTLMLISQRRG